MDQQALSAALQPWVDRNALAGVSYAVLRDGELVAQDCLGWADREAGVPLRPDHLFRVFSNTKLVTSIAALQLVEQGRLHPDDPVADYIPALARLRVLRPGATSLDDTEPAREPVRLRHLMTHTAGFSYAFLRPGTPLAQAAEAAGVGDPQRTLAQMCEALGQLPLLFQPGSAWEYSVATDVLGRVIEVVNGQALDACLRRQVLEPLEMEDTAFVIPPGQAHRLAALYVGDPRDPAQPLRRADHLPWPGAYLRPVPRLNAGGGLVSSLGDHVKLVRALLRGGAPLLGPATLPLLAQNQLPPGQWIGFPGLPTQVGRGHSFGGAVSVALSPTNTATAPGEYSWGGMAGTQWFVSPGEGLAGVLMTQRYLGYGLPYWNEFKTVLRDLLHSQH